MLWRACVCIGLLAVVGCAAPPAAAPTPPQTPTPAPVATQAVATLTPRPAAPPTTTPAASAAALATVETVAPQQGPGFLTPVELELVLQQPVSDAAELRRLVEGVQELSG